MKKQILALLIICLLIGPTAAQGEADGVSHMVRISDMAFQMDGETVLEIPGLSFTVSRLNDSLYLRADAGEAGFAAGCGLKDDLLMLFVDGMEEIYATPAKNLPFFDGSQNAEFALPDGRTVSASIVRDARGGFSAAAEGENAYLEAGGAQAGGSSTWEISAALDDLSLQATGVNTGDTCVWRAHFSGDDGASSFFVTMAYEGDIALQDGARTETGLLTLSAENITFSARVEIVRLAADANASFVTESEHTISLDSITGAEKTALFARIRDRAIRFAMDALNENAQARDFVSMIAAPQANDELSAAQISGILEGNFSTDRP